MTAPWADMQTYTFRDEKLGKTMRVGCGETKDNEEGRNTKEEVSKCVFWVAVGTRSAIAGPGCLGPP